MKKNVERFALKQTVLLLWPLSFVQKFLNLNYYI